MSLFPGQRGHNMPRLSPAWQRRMRGYLPILVLFVVLDGCAYYSGPEGAVRFSPLGEPQALVGIFHNEGDPAGNLSILLFGFATLQDTSSGIVTRHEEIDFIQISAVAEGILVQAISGGCAVAEKELRLGRDFEFVGGRLVLETDTHYLTRGSGDITFGPSTSKTVLGIGCTDTSYGEARIMRRYYWVCCCPR